MRAPYVLKSQTNFVSFMNSLVNSTSDKRIPHALKSHEVIVERVFSHTQMKWKDAWEI